MAYAQTNYPQRLGNGDYTIAQAGCFLTAFSNLLERFGDSIDPPNLNNFFLQHNSYMADPEEGTNIRDYLGWGSVSNYDAQIVPSSINGAGWPNSANAIVKFSYRSARTGQLVTHFCLVADPAAHTIVDSWDGVVKVSPYGTPIASATYERHAPQVVSPPAPANQPPYTVEGIAERAEQLKVDTHLWDLTQRSWPGMVNNPVSGATAGTQFTTTAIAHHFLGGSYYLPDPNVSHGYNIVDCQDAPTPPPQPAPEAPAVPRPLPTAPLTATSNDPYNVVKDIPGYWTSNQAVNRMGSNSIVPAGTYLIFNKRLDPATNRLIALNITRKSGQPGWWINPADNVVAPIPAAPTDTQYVGPRESSTAPAAPTEPNWRSTYRAFVNKNGIPTPVLYVALGNYVVKDLATQKADAALHGTDTIWIAGTFVKDGVVYGRPLEAVQDRNGTLRGWWYGIPLDGTIIEEYDKVYNTQTTTADRQLLDTMTFYDYVVVGFETLRNMLAPVFAPFTNKDRKQ